MAALRFFFRRGAGIASLLLGGLSCSQPLTGSSREYLTFTVVNVGQGNAAIAVTGDSALLFDTGPSEGFDSLMSQYTALGSPPLAAILLSHRDSDHAGALSRLPDSLRWSGRLIGSSGDSAVACSLCTRPVRWTSFTRSDTLRCTNELIVACFWPQQEEHGTLSVNNSGLVLHVSFGTTTALITGDIDTVVTRRLCELYGIDLASDLLLVPHHGSRYSADRLWYGFVNPTVAIISAGTGNEYGHPHVETLQLLTRCSIPYRSTITDGSMQWLSNGFYWTEQF